MTSDLDQEVAQVRHTLSEISDTLHPMLSEFIRHEIESRLQLDLAAVVLAAAYPLHDSAIQQQRRVYLAAALELLTIALEIHKLLLTAGTGHADVDRKLAGGTVLAGDYCFSRAAGMAAQTDNAEVVTIFSTLLQMISEGNLRQIFQSSADPTEQRQLLYRSGVQAGTVLADIDDTASTAAMNLSAQIAAKLDPYPSLSAIAPHQTERWQQILAHSS